MEKNNKDVFDYINLVILSFFIVIMIYPFWYILMYSFSNARLALSGGPFLVPKGFSVDSFRSVFNNKSVLSGFSVSVIVTLIGAPLGTLLTAMIAYPLSKREFLGRRVYMFLIFFTMLFNGGLVPTYLLVKKLNMLDSMAALVIPNILHAWNIIVMRNFFIGIPDSLEESAKIDGANDLIVFTKIILPLSKPVLATIALFLSVGYWNDYFSTTMYITTKSKWALQAVLREIITSTAAAMQMQGVNIVTSQEITEKSVTMAAIMISTIPILVVYPFVQKYFTKGVMVGSVKG